MKRVIFLLMGILFNCGTTSSWWSTMYRSDNLRIVEFDNSKRYIHIREKKGNSDITYIHSCLENVGPSAKDEFYKVMLSNPAGVKLGIDGGTKASNIYNVGEIMQFGNTALYRLCESYMNGSYDHFGSVKDIKYRRDINEIMRKVALLIAIHSAENSEKETIVAIINALDRKYELNADIIQINVRIEELEKNKPKDYEKEISILSELQKEYIKLEKQVSTIVTETKSIRCKEDCNEEEKKTNNPKSNERIPKKDSTGSNEKSDEKGRIIVNTEFIKDCFYPVYFDYNRANIKSESQEHLNSIRNILNKVDTRVYIVGHTDSDGSEFFNRKLSCKRAKTVADYLFKNGNKAEKILVFGCGESNLFKSYNENNKEVKSVSRRVEFLPEKNFLASKNCIPCEG